MRRLLRDESRHEHLVTSGWAPLPALDPEVTARLRGLAVEMQESLVRHSRSSDVGFDELWGNAEESLRREVQAQIAVAVAPFLQQTFEGFRPILYNFFVKRQRSPGSAVRYHQDFAMIDERGGDTALQLWVPLVDTTADNGALIVVERSHLDATWRRPHDFVHPLRNASLTDLPPGARSLSLPAGHGIVFTNRTIHGSPPNRAGDDRYALGCVMVPRDLPLVHLVEKPGGGVEIWSFSDEDMLSFHPGCFPASARLVETVAAATPAVDAR
jgi:ectoine hydroxylase-related dioxygenase (phytanoyl-CoA dioxygenase family)